MHIQKTYYLQFKTTEACQLFCKHCYIGQIRKEKQFEVKPTCDFIKKFIDEKIKIHTKIDLKVVFHGGEPFMCDLNKIIDVINFSREYVKDKPQVNLLLLTTTNLCYKLTDKHKDIFRSLDNVSVSWNADDINRFPTQFHKDLWKNNVLELSNDDQIQQSLMITVSKDVVKTNVKEHLEWMKSLKVKGVLYERLAMFGSIKDNLEIVPTYEEYDEWLLELFKEYVAGEYYNHFYNTFFRSIIGGFLGHSNNFAITRKKCSEMVYTIDPDGVIFNCYHYMADRGKCGTIEDDLKEIEKKIKLSDLSCLYYDVKEKCLECELYKYCRGGCPTLWEGENCPVPIKTFSYIINTINNNEVIYKKLI